MSLIAHKVHKTLGEPPTKVLTDINFEIKDGEFVALTGRSGSGKSTLLYLLSSLDTPTQGYIEIDKHNVSQMTKLEVCKFRNEQMGFVFQFHYLIAELSALENVLMPAKKAGLADKKKNYAQDLLKQFGLADKPHRLPRQLSGGEQQRVAIARALVMQPKYLFADEPTGSLDSHNSEVVMNIIREANQNLGTTVIMVTHDVGFAKQARRQIHLVDGKVVSS
ncbi:MAG: ABC transporter ATP-binding protein [Oligoflexia bacterium]|nr:ABC transporter ATP-binding protein [Oligoflexia bacterium]